MIVVSDTTAISNLLQIKQVDLLPTLFGRVLIPPAVWQELNSWHTDLPDWLEVVPVQNPSQTAGLRHFVHQGEAEAIALAREIQPDWILLDDSDGRRVAKEFHLPVLGLMGVLLLAKKQGLLKEIKPVVAQLQEEAGFFLSKEVRREVLRLAREG